MHPTFKHSTFRASEPTYNISQEDLEVNGKVIKNALIVCVSNKLFKDPNNIPSEFEKIFNKTYRIHLTNVNSKTETDQFYQSLMTLKNGQTIFNECIKFLEPDYRPTMT